MAARGSGLFAASTSRPATKPGPLAAGLEKTADNFLSELQNYASVKAREVSTWKIKEKLMDNLRQSVKNKTVTPEEGMKLGALAIHAFMIEQAAGDQFLWSKKTITDDSLLKIFNTAPYVEYWKQFSAASEAKPSPQPLDLTQLKTIVSKLNDQADLHSFNPTVQRTPGFR